MWYEAMVKRRTVAAVAMLTVVTLAGCANHVSSNAPLTVPSDYSTATDTGGPVGSDPASVTYSVSSNGTKASSITYTDSGSIEQATDARVPWLKTVTPGLLAQVSAQNGDGTSITCTITDADGAVLATHTATGPYAIVSCQH